MKQVKLSGIKIGALASILTATLGPDVADKLRQFLLVVASLLS